MACNFPPGSIYGEFVRIIFQSIDRSFTVGDGHWRNGGSGDGRLGRLSYDRVERDESFKAGIDISSAGVDFGNGVGFRMPYKFTLQLWLSHPEYSDMCAIYERQRNDPTLDALLYDHRIALSEESPRTRARFDAGYSFSYVSPGQDLFWPIYRVFFQQEPKVESLAVRTGGQEIYAVELELLEKFPALGMGGDGDPP